VIDLLGQYLAWGDQVFACGSGVCYCCGIFIRRGVRLVCKDSQRFDPREVW
jgi:hypothetical protein